MAGSIDSLGLVEYTIHAEDYSIPNYIGIGAVIGKVSVDRYYLENGDLDGAISRALEHKFISHDGDCGCLYGDMIPNYESGERKRVFLVLEIDPVTGEKR